MGCIKLDILEKSFVPMKVVYSNSNFEQKNIQRWLSVDPITKQYPELTPYQFASNSPISGIDLDGLEYLNANDARIEIVNGSVSLKLQNFLRINRNAWEIANKDPNNWSYTNGVKDIGISREIRDLKFIFPSAKTESFSDVPTPSILEGMVEGGLKTRAYNRAGRSEIRRKGGILNVKSRTGGGAKGLVLIDAINLGYENYKSIAATYDSDIVSSNLKVVPSVLQNLNSAISDGMVGYEYINLKDLSKIADVILQGENKNYSKSINKLGMAIFNKYSFKPKTDVTSVPSGLDNNGDKKYVPPVESNRP